MQNKGIGHLVSGVPVVTNLVPKLQRQTSAIR